MLYMFQTLLVHHQEKSFISCTLHLVYANTYGCCVVVFLLKYLYFLVAESLFPIVNISKIHMSCTHELTNIGHFTGRTWTPLL
jgi:hypothetical protein